jgi:hypothetical protein
MIQKMELLKEVSHPLFKDYNKQDLSVFTRSHFEDAFSEVLRLDDEV